MSTILVIQPYKMLQHAYAAALPFEHQVRVVEALPDAGALKDFDVVIVDSAALMEKAALGARDLRAVQSWQLPTVWIENDGGAAAPRRDRLVVLKRPVQREALQRALTECLGLTAGKPTVPPLTKVIAKPAAKEPKKAKEPSSAAPTPAVIELVEVVEEAPAQEEISTQEN